MRAMKMQSVVRLAAIAAAVAISACNTVTGVGQDVEKVGSGISKGAQKVEKKIQN